MRLGVLSKRLGVTFNPLPLADDKEYMVQSRTPTDHSLLLTNQFLAHASISALSRSAARAAILFVGPGSFDEAPLADGLGTTKVNKVIRSMRTTYRDLPNATGARNFSFDKETEKRAQYNLVVAVEGGPLEDATSMRVVLIADAEVLSDAILGRVAVVQNMLIDVIKWTGGEEAYAGETISEKDKRIEHTKNQDAIWFYGTMVGAPLLMLGIGLLFVGRRRRRTVRRKS